MLDTEEREILLKVIDYSTNKPVGKHDAMLGGIIAGLLAKYDILLEEYNKLKE